MYSCRALSEYLEVLKGLILTHPTISVRRLLNNSNLHARAGIDIIEVYSCTRLNITQYKLLPMNDSCTEFIPIEFEYLGAQHRAYLDATLNIVHPVTRDQSCITSQDVPVYLDGTMWLYAPDGRLRKAEGITAFDFAGFHLEAPEFNIPQVIYRTVTMLNWQDFMEHHSLNEMYSVATAQRRVLEAMGMKLVGDPVHAANENIEEIFKRGYLGFLIGHRVGSPFEIWTFFVCLVVTMWVVKTGICVILGCKKNGYKNVIGYMKNKSVKTIAKMRWGKVRQVGKTGQDDAVESNIENNQCDQEQELADEEDLPDLNKLYPQLQALLKESRINTLSGSYYVPIIINGRKYEGLLDSGSSLSLMTEVIFKKLNISSEPIHVTATSVTGHRLNLSGQADVTVLIGGKLITHRFGIMGGNATEEIILGSDFLAKISPFTMDLEGEIMTIRDGNQDRVVKLLNSHQ